MNIDLLCGHEIKYIGCKICTHMEVSAECAKQLKTSFDQGVKKGRKEGLEEAKKAVYDAGFVAAAYQIQSLISEKDSSGIDAGPGK